MNWYKKSQVRDRQLGDPFIPDEEEYLYMTGRDTEYSDLLQNRNDREDFLNQEEKRNARHHKKMLDVRPLEEEKRELEKYIKFLYQIVSSHSQQWILKNYPNEPSNDSEMYEKTNELTKLINKIDRKISTIIGRK